jgi:hypothetical protein
VASAGRWKVVLNVPDGTVLAEEVEELLRSDVVAIPSQYVPSK